MNTDFTQTRRDAIKNVFEGSLAIVALLAVKMPVAATETATAPPFFGAYEFIPENDYPYFGWQPEAKLR